MAVSVGLEIGTTAVRAVVLDSRNKPPQLLAAVTAPLSGSSGDELVRAIQQVRRSLPIRSPVILGLPTSAAIVTTVQPLVVSRARSELAVSFELQQHLPYEAAQAAWHYQWFSLNGQSKSSAAVVAAVKHAVLQERLTACQRAGVAVKGVQINAVAVANAWLSTPTAGGALPSLIVRCDGRLVEWIVITAGGLYVFPHLLPFPSAPSPPSGAAGGIIQAGLAQAHEDQMVTWLKSSWEGLQNSLTAAATTLASTPTVWCVGGAEAGQQLGACLQRAVGAPVQSLATTALARLPAQIGGDDFVATCGLAFQGAGPTRVSLNLIQGMLRRRHAARLHLGAQFIGVLAALLAALWSAAGIVTSLHAREAVVEAYRKEEHSYQLLRPEVRSIRRHQAHLEARLTQLEFLARTHDRMSRSLLYLTETLPDSLWLTMLDLSKSIPHITGTLEGYAQSFQGVTQFIDRVKAEPEWVTVKPQATNVMTDPTTRTEVVAFAIQVQRLLEAPSATDASAGAEKTQKAEEGHRRPQKAKKAKKK
ncbi:MAG: pilus assembly protein PilM [Candidatus Omnitrophica bacterium]|nr:pilus assembly protein PilM [Candidatus Omnitrophota bacterium]